MSGGLGEFELIDALVARLDPAADGLGIGDDAAAWEATPGKLVVATTDMLVQDVHFRLDWTSARDLGWKALAVNLSDLAAMGAEPGRALVSVALLAEQAGLVQEMYEGLAELARSSGTSVVGGDTVRTSGPLVVNVAIVGEVEPGRLLRRDAAVPGDLVLVTGCVGASAAGLELLLDGDAERLSTPEAGQLLVAHHRPQPRLTAGRAIARLGLRCAIDISDGVASEAWHLARASGVEIRLEPGLLPLHHAAVSMLGEARARGLALSGGEDYQLLFTAPEDRLREIVEAMAPEGPVTVVGRVTGRYEGGRVELIGDAVDAHRTGYVAF